MIKFAERIMEQFSFPLHNPILVFSVILFIILLAPMLMNRFRIPGIIGLILSGVFVGPNGLQILEKTSAIELFSTIGLLYIMFIAGLDLDMVEFRHHRKKSFIFGFFTFFIPLLLGLPVCRFVLGYDMTASLLISSMFSTHTLIAYPIVSRYGISKNIAVAITVGGTLLTDTAVLLLLAVILGHNQGAIGFEFWLQLAISLILFFSIMFVLIPVLARWFFQNLESEKHAHYIFVLSVLFFSAFLSEMAGVESIIGAFMAGLTLNKLIPASSPLMNRIEYIGNALFIPFFLISVGMVVDVSLIFSGPSTWIVSGILVGVALAGKWLAANLTKVVFGLSKYQGRLIFGLSSSHAAATLAIILVGFKNGIINETVLNATVILILISCIVASMVTEKTTKKIIATENLLSQEERIFSAGEETILVPVVNISRLEKLLEFAILMKSRKSRNPITMLMVVPNNEKAEANIIESRKHLQKFVSQAAATDISINTVAAIDHNPASGIARVSREIMSDIVILGWPGKSGLIERITGDKMDTIVNQVDKNLFICNIVKPFIANRRICLFAPPLSEREAGFSSWLDKVVLISTELGIEIDFYVNNLTSDAIKTVFDKKSHKLLRFHDFTNWIDLTSLGHIIHPMDFIIVIGVKKGSVSWFSGAEKIPSRMETYLENNNMTLIYPRLAFNAS